MKGSVLPVLAALAAMGIAADVGAQSAFDSNLGDASPVSEEALSAVTSSGEDAANAQGGFVSRFAKDFSDDLVTVDDNVTTGLVGSPAGGSFPVFGVAPVGRFTHPNF